MHRHKIVVVVVVACGSSSSVRVECEGGAAAWVTGTLVVSSVQGYGLAQPLEL